MIEGFFGDDLDGLEVHGPPGDHNNPAHHTYFSIDRLSESNTNIILGDEARANDIFLDSIFSTWASGENDIGLLAGDDLDALILDDITVGPGVLDSGTKENPGDIALFSLSQFSPTVLNGGTNCANDPISVSSSDVLVTNFGGCFDIFATANQMGLRVDDNIDALDIAGIIPEPSTFSLVALGLAGLGLARNRRRHACLSSADLGPARRGFRSD